jgi:hypothetical protein
MNFIKRYCVLLRINMFDSNSSKKNEKEVLSFYSICLGLLF